jgi:hypothetical protein
MNRNAKKKGGRERETDGGEGDKTETTRKVGWYDADSNFVVLQYILYSEHLLKTHSTKRNLLSFGCFMRVSFPSGTIPFKCIITGIFISQKYCCELPRVVTGE